MTNSPAEEIKDVPLLDSVSEPVTISVNVDQSVPLTVVVGRVL